MECARCLRSAGLCRGCSARRYAEHFRTLYADEHDRLTYHGDVSRLPFERLSAIDQASWLAVAIGVRDMER